MVTINDFATTYMNQSLPFGGVKDSGFDRFAGVEGLRGVCVARAVCQDRCGRQKRREGNPCKNLKTFLVNCFSKLKIIHRSDHIASLGGSSASRSPRRSIDV